MSSRKKWLIAFALLALIAIGLQSTFWFGKNSFTSFSELQNQIETEKTHNKNLQQRNNLLKAEVIDLQTGDETMEERARMELGLIKEGETFYRIVEIDEADSANQ